MKTSSAKAKGRRFQQWVRDLLIEDLDIHPEDIESRSMGAGGEDLIMARAAREKFPMSIECKNQEKLNIWKALEQSRNDAPRGKTPLVVFTKNFQLDYVDIEFNDFINLLLELEEFRNQKNL